MQLPDHIQLEDPNIVPMDDALERAFDLLKLQRLGGASGKGWSRYNVLQTCPRKFQLRYVKKIRGEEKKPLSVGSAAHAFLALYYDNMRRLYKEQEEGPAPSQLRDMLLDVGANAEYVAEGWRLFGAYADYYEHVNDYLIPLAVEHLATDPETGRTCRYDLVAKIDEERATAIAISPGTYIVEHKFLRQKGSESAWHLDGEIIGQLMLWRRARLAGRWGKLQGVIVNITTKATIPKFHREIVAPPFKVVSVQRKHLDVWDGIEQIHRAMDVWPKAMSACNGRYGLCDYFELCRESK